VDDVLRTVADGIANAFQMAWEMWRALILGFALSGIVQAWVTRGQMERVMGGRGVGELAGAGAGAVAGGGMAPRKVSGALGVRPRAAGEHHAGERSADCGTSWRWAVSVERLPRTWSANDVPSEFVPAERSPRQRRSRAG